MAARLWVFTALICLWNDPAARPHFLYNRTCPRQVPHLVAVVAGLFLTSTSYCSVVKPQAQLALLLRVLTQSRGGCVAGLQGQQWRPCFDGHQWFGTFNVFALVTPYVITDHLDQCNPYNDCRCLVAMCHKDMASHDGDLTVLSNEKRQNQQC